MTGIPQSRVLTEFYNGLCLWDFSHFGDCLQNRSSCKMVLKLRDSFCGHFAWSPKAYWGQAVLKEKSSLFLFKPPNLNFPQFLRMQPRG